jgi:serine/threonine protein phosphatase PrpC
MTDQPTLPQVPTLLEQLTAAFGERIAEIQNVEDLKQAFEDRRTLRLIGFKYDIMLAALADGMGPGGRDAASEASAWSPQTIKRLALLLEVQEQLLSPDLPLGAYWYVLVTKSDDLTPQEQAEALTWARNNSASVADIRQRLGDEPERTGGTVVHCEAIDQNGRTVTVEGDELQAVQFKGYPVSVRRLKR